MQEYRCESGALKLNLSWPLGGATRLRQQGMSWRIFLSVYFTLLFTNKFQWAAEIVQDFHDSRDHSQCLLTPDSFLFVMEQQRKRWKFTTNRKPLRCCRERTSAHATQQTWRSKREFPPQCFYFSAGKVGQNGVFFSPPLSIHQNLETAV